MMKTSVKGYLCVTGAFILHITLGSLYTFGNMSPYIASYMRRYNESNWVTNSDMIWIFGVSMGIQGFTTMLGGMIDRIIGARATCLLGCWMMSISIMLTYFTIQQNLYLVILSYGVIVGLGTGLTYTVAISEAIKWFPKRRGLIIGIVVGGFGLGSLIFNQVQTAFINPSNISPNITYGNDKYFNDDDMLQRVPICFLLVGSIYGILQLLGCLILFHKRTDDIKTYRTDLDFTETETEFFRNDDVELKKPLLNLERVTTPPTEALKMWDFWILWITLLFCGTMNVFITSLYKIFGQRFISNDLYLTVVGSIASIFNAGGRIVWGQIMDRFSYKISMRTLTVIMALFSGSFGFIEYISIGGLAQVMHMIWSCVMMSTISGVFTILPSVSVKLFGSDNVAITYGLLFTATGVSGLTGAISTNFLESKINYIGIFELGTALCIASFLLTFCLKSKSL